MHALGVVAAAWQWNAAGLICCAALLLLYVGLGVWRSPRHLVVFLAAEAMIAVVVCSPLDALAREYLLSAEALERIALAQLAPYLLLFAIPQRPGRGRISLDYRIAWIAGMGAITLWFIPQPLDWALSSEPARLVEFATLIAGGMAFWWPIHSPLLGSRIPLVPKSLFYLATATIWISIEGLFLAFGPPGRYLHYVVPADTLHIYTSLIQDWSLTREYDQQTGGLLFWIIAGFIVLSEVMLVYWRWCSAEGRP
ncbi:MAG: cytochrome c oxidase assembly protein [Bryobacteraceae bacterium]